MIWPKCLLQCFSLLASVSLFLSRGANKPGIVDKALLISLKM